MLFNSYIFLLAYLPATLVVFFLLGKKHYKASIAFLGIASMVFYGWWRLEYVLILILSILYNFTFGILISRAGKRDSFFTPKRLLIAGVSGNILMLSFYKYFGFFLENIGMLFEMNIVPHIISLPLGI